MKSDEELMAAYAAGDPTAFGDLFERYAPKLTRMMRRKISSPEAAEDLVQQTFLQVHRARRDYDSRRPFRPWIWTIALNLQREHFRRLGRRPEASLDHEPPASSKQPLRLVEQAGRAAELRRAVADLPATQREVIELHWFDELSFPEVARVLGVGLSAVKVRAHRAYGTLRKALEDVTENASTSYDEREDEP
ncbi:MAG: sigma-70 family RNA polymerase sigma factor [Deltaproteobacteria bacterium]|jgi:RNA polymerase sigma-70 factor (ECF subfamily)|nr:sigma-70 family RNA polymerase sigma factor [Deltaproteobacteria bacterium]MBW2537080.1 sigma-70 family RNA polymerase sigma factor [Deltaproteobacteria bacterium]